MTKMIKNMAIRMVNMVNLRYSRFHVLPDKSWSVVRPLPVFMSRVIGKILRLNTKSRLRYIVCLLCPWMRRKTWLSFRSRELQPTVSDRIVGADRSQFTDSPDKWRSDTAVNSIPLRKLGKKSITNKFLLCLSSQPSQDLLLLAWCIGSVECHQMSGLSRVL